MTDLKSSVEFTRLLRLERAPDEGRNWKLDELWEWVCVRLFMAHGLERIARELYRTGRWADTVDCMNPWWGSKQHFIHAVDAARIRDEKDGDPWEVGDTSDGEKRIAKLEYDLDLANLRCERILARLKNFETENYP